jgi:putative hemolysin
MLEKGLQTEERPRRQLIASLARCQDEVFEAQRLRHRIFEGEMGARVPGRELGIDCDRFDPYCEHLLVRDSGSGRVVGTYRILNGAMARRIGGFYSDQEFDLDRFGHLRDELVEVGRSCVHPAYRTGAAIALLWSGLTAYMATRGYRYVMGCASIGMADGGQVAAGVYQHVVRAHLSPPEYRVFPRCALPLQAYGDLPNAPVPPLIKGYLRLGSYVCGAPAWDPDFNTADLLMMLPLARMDTRYARHFLKHDG